MCGIGGWLGAVPNGEYYARCMAKALHHRGPDDSGIWSSSQASLVHTRLSVIDLSPTGAQPLSNEDGTVWVVFNGEIYNHRELRRNLETHGHILKGHSDTQILPHLYEEYGSAFVAKLRGMFAIAIFDTKAQTLILTRDRFGIKPLFYSTGNRYLAFASEINALRKIPETDDRIDNQALYDFAALFYIPAPATFYAGIRALEPGKMLEVRLDAGGIRTTMRYYHCWSIAPNPALTLNEAVEQSDALLTSAVCKQIESDVPLGTLLSGGIDSSLVSAAAYDTLNGQLRTFNVRFSDTKYDETWAAIEAARHIGSHHQVLEMETSQGTWEGVTRLLLHAGQPFADTSLFAVNAVCHLMRQHVTVALSGDGGDEGFGGYDFYWQLAKMARRQMFPPWVWRQVSPLLKPFARLGVVSEDLPRRAIEIAAADNTSLIQELFCSLSEKEHNMLCRSENVLPVRRLFEPQWQHHLPRHASRVERLSAHTTEVNTRLELPNDFLFKVDTGSMRESLEVRVPMLDEDLFSFALSLPHRLKVTGRTSKRVLRAIARRKLPPGVANKPKQGFGIPVDTWVDSNFKHNLMDVLLGSSSKLPEFFRPQAYRPVIEAFCNGQSCPGITRKGLYQRAIMLLSVQLTLADTRHG